MVLKEAMRNTQLYYIHLRRITAFGIATILSLCLRVEEKKLFFVIVGAFGLPALFSFIKLQTVSFILLLIFLC